MKNQKYMQIVLAWTEQGPMGYTGHRPEWHGRQIYTPDDYPQKLPCHNPDCEDGGFEIGDKIAKLLASEEDNEPNSLVCSNAIHADKSKRCRHTILYEIRCVRPFQRKRETSTVSN